MVSFTSQNNPVQAMNAYFLALLALLPYTPADASMMTYHQAVFTGLPQLWVHEAVAVGRAKAQRVRPLRMSAQVLRGAAGGQT